jgi:uncharacterized membrane protein
MMGDDHLTVRRESPMSDLVAIVYPSEAKAEEIRQKLFGLQKDYLIEIADAVIAVKQPDGKVKLNQLLNTTATGALSGGFWGLLVGTIFLMPIFGAAIGAASGALGGALTDYGINDDFMKQLAESLQPGNAALFVLIRKMTGDKVLEHLRGTGGVVLRTSLDHTKEQALRDALAGAPAIAEPAPATPAAPGTTAAPGVSGA